MPELTLPLGGTVKYRGMTGRDEDILSNRKKVRTGEAIDEVLSNCILEMPNGKKATPSAVNKMFSPDRMALLLAVRIESFGPDMVMELENSEKEKFEVKIDLAEAVESVPAPEQWDPESDDKYPFKISIDDYDDEGNEIEREVSWGYPTGGHEKIVAKSDDILTMSILVRLGEVEGIHANDKKRWLKDLPVRKRTQLRDAIAQTECGPSLSLTADDPSTGEEIPFSVMDSPNFFFPSL